MTTWCDEAGTEILQSREGTRRRLGTRAGFLEEATPELVFEAWVGVG